jgi:hypothetical protein
MKVVLGIRQHSPAAQRWLPSVAAVALALALSLTLSACGNSSDDSGSGVATPARGSLVGTPTALQTVTAGTLLQQLTGLPGQQLLTLSGTPTCDINVFRITYNTVGGANEATTATAAVMIPSGADASCTGARPVVLYAHGTTTDKNFDIANLQDTGNAEGLLIAAYFAAHGDIVVAPSYAGYNTSTLAYHPYLVGDQQSKDMIDALTAARKALPMTAVTQTTDGGKLFITGYSQGGYVAMATHRAMQAAGMTVTASAPMSGPYALAAFVDAVFTGEVNGGAPVSSTLLITGYQKSYGNIYANSTDIFETHYASGIASLLPSTETRGALYSEGKLPQYALFSATPPDPSYASITPATTPASLAEVFAVGFGAGNLITNDYRLRYLQDAAANPDGGWPTVTTGVAAAAPALAWRAALKTNDLRNWTPNAPTLLCGGDNDPVVFWLNTELIQNYWNTHAPAPASVTVLDVDAAATSGDAYADIKTGFSAAKAVVAAAAVLGGASDGGDAAVADAYHATLVAPFCLVAVRSFFDGL